MPGTTEDISKIYKLNEVDKKIHEITNDLDDPPIKNEIIAVRSKKAQIKAKRDQIEVIFVKTRDEFKTMSEKDSEIVQAQKNLQKEIEATSGDYRKVQNSTNKLAELKAQREEIDANLVQVEANYNKIKSLKAQIDEAIDNLSLKEDDLTKLFVEQNATNTRELSVATEERKELQKSISPEVLKLYSQVLERVGSNCISELKKEEDGEGGHTADHVCSVCRNRLTSGQTSTAQKNAPFFKCPHCGRLLVVK